VKGGVPAGIAGIISTVTIVLLNGSLIKGTVETLGYTGSTQSLFLGLIVGSAFAGFALFFVLGIVGSVIRVALKKIDQDSTKQEKYTSSCIEMV